MTATIRHVGDNVFVVEQKTDWHAVTVRVIVPRRDGRRIYSDEEREDIACKKAQLLALDFAESLLGEKCVSMSKGGEVG